MHRNDPKTGVAAVENLQPGEYHDITRYMHRGKQIERCLISTFKIAERMGFKGDYRQWEDLLRSGG